MKKFCTVSKIPLAAVALLFLAAALLPSCKWNWDDPVGSRVLAGQDFEGSTALTGQRVVLNRNGAYVLGCYASGAGDAKLGVARYDRPNKMMVFLEDREIHIDAQKEWNTFESPLDLSDMPSSRDNFIVYVKDFNPGGDGDVYVDHIWLYNLRDDPDRKTNLLGNDRFSDLKKINTDGTGGGEYLISQQNEVNMAKLGYWYLDWKFTVIAKVDMPRIPNEKNKPKVETFVKQKLPYFGPEPSLPAKVPGNNYKNVGVYLWDRNPTGIDYFQDWIGTDVNYAEDFIARFRWSTFRNDAVEEWEWGRIKPWIPWKDEDPARHRLILAVPPFPMDADGLPGEDSGYEGTQSMTNNLAFQKAAAGDYNDNYAILGKRLIAAGLHDTIIRFGHEMDGDWYVYSVRTGFNREEKQENFKLSFRQFVETLRALPCIHAGEEFLPGEFADRGCDSLPPDHKHFEFVWNPNLGHQSEDLLKRTWPGKDYVDYVGFDGYDHWFPEAYDYNYQYIADATQRRQAQEYAWETLRTKPAGFDFFTQFAKDQNLPLAVCEWGMWYDPPSLKDGGDNAYFVRQYLNWINTNNVAFHVYFMFGDVPHSVWEVYRYPNGSREFLAWFRNDVPADYPYNLEKDPKNAWRPVAPSLPPPAPWYTGKPPREPTTHYASKPEDLIAALAGKQIVDVLSAQEAIYTGSAWLAPSPWSYSGGVNVGLAFRTRPAANMNPTSIIFKKPKEAQHVIVVYSLLQQLWRQTIPELGGGDLQIGLYESGIRVKTVPIKIGDRGYGDSYNFTVVENVNVQGGNELRLQMDAEDVAYNTRPLTPNYETLDIDYVILYND
ncbi:MAG: glycoside hydrolase family 26 protein [Treponema sp.]|nr:glycoside hydrolase family 26 protein [Treponema sp.]